MFCILLYSCLFFRISCRMMSAPRCLRFTDWRVRSVFVYEIGLLWNMQVQHYFCTVGLFLPTPPWCKPIMVFFFLDCGVFDFWFGACSHVCVYIYRTGKRVETGDHSTGRPAEGSAEKQHQSGEEAGIWEVNTSTGGLSLTQKESCFLCTSIPTFGNNG